MRALARSLRQVRYLSQFRGGVLSLNGFGENEKVPILRNPAACSLIKPSHDKEIGRYLNQSLVLLRTLSTVVANEATGGFLLTPSLYCIFIMLKSFLSLGIRMMSKPFLVHCVYTNFKQFEFFSFIYLLDP